MQKITLINVDLGATIEEIVNDDVRELTEQNEQAIAEALVEAKETQEKKAAKQNQSNLEQQRIATIMSKVYETMVANHKAGLSTPLSKMLELTNPTITKAGSLIPRLKTFIKDYHDRSYSLKRCQKGGETHYKLIEFNAD
jgi:hypothetical protein